MSRAMELMKTSVTWDHVTYGSLRTWSYLSGRVTAEGCCVLTDRDGNKDAYTYRSPNGALMIHHVDVNVTQLLVDKSIFVSLYEQRIPFSYNVSIYRLVLYTLATVCSSRC